MAVRIGSARINEKGTTTGGKPGDQTGNEVAIQNWYPHKKGWYVARPKEVSVAEKIAQAMEAACNNNHIGYCQAHRDSLRKIAVKYNYNLNKVTVNVETDCSALVRVCCLYAGIQVGDFNTASELETLRRTGKFEILKDDKYCKSSTYLKRGDILVTRTKGHTVVVLDNGPGTSSAQKPATPTGNDWIRRLQSECNNQKFSNQKVDGIAGPKTLAGCPTLKKGSRGNITRLLQEKLGVAVDGIFGQKTKSAVIAFQKAHGLKEDGIVGQKTWRALLGL